VPPIVNRSVEYGVWLKPLHQALSRAVPELSHPFLIVLQQILKEIFLHRGVR
jgi:hypothetical protein